MMSTPYFEGESVGVEKMKPRRSQTEAKQRLVKALYAAREAPCLS